MLSIFLETLTPIERIVHKAKYLLGANLIADAIWEILGEVVMGKWLSTITKEGASLLYSLHVSQ